MSLQISHLPSRTDKPRDFGITLTLDTGFSVRQAEDFCEVASGLVDIVKLGWGTSLVTNGLEKKLQIYAEYGIPVYFGGTLFEAYLLRDKLDEYVSILRDFGIQHVEVSNGTVWLSEKKKLDIIESLAGEFIVLSEVGSKDPKEVIPPYKWVEMIKNELDAGAWKVICEARESGNVGVFRPTGEVRSGLIDEITHHADHEKLIFEAPKKEQQVWFIKKFGSNVNLGNIRPEDVISVETLRLGLRSDTLFDFHAVNEEKMEDILPKANITGISQENSSTDNSI